VGLITLKKLDENQAVEIWGKEISVAVDDF
jgi:hypothetical protein